MESVSLDGTEMDASAYRLEMAGRRLVHLPEFTPYPMGRLSVSYTARDTTAQRRLATIRLCTLESEYIGVSSRGAGVVSITPADYRSDRAEILRSLAAFCTGRWV